MKISLLCFALMLIAASSFAATEEQADATLKKLLTAQESKNYADFVADATPALKTALSQAQFEAAADVLKARFKDGYETKYLGELKQQGCQVFYYRIRCKDDGDDLLASLAMKDDKVAGIFFR